MEVKLLVYLKNMLRLYFSQKQQQQKDKHVALIVCNSYSLPGLTRVQRLSPAQTQVAVL